jgi:hypothetical protein
MVGNVAWLWVIGMKWNRGAAAAITLVGAIGASTVGQSAWASSRTYDFTVTVASGPLAGTVAPGRLSFEEGLVPEGGFGRVVGTGLLTSFAFLWNGVAYNEGTADAITLGFGGYPYLGSRQLGELTSFVIGNHCRDPQAPDTCLVLNNSNDWRGRLGLAFDPDLPGVREESAFYFALPGEITTFAIGPSSPGPIQITAVPEPSSPALLIAGLCGMFAVTRRRSKGVQGATSPR